MSKPTSKNTSTETSTELNSLINSVNASTIANKSNSSLLKPLNGDSSDEPIDDEFTGTPHVVIPDGIIPE